MKNLLIVCLILTAVNSAMGQEPISNLYQYNYTSVSPAFAGLDGQKITTMINYFSNGSYVNSSGFVGYELTIDKINSGLGFTASRGGLGAQSETYLNLLYNFQWKVGNGKFVFGAKITDYIDMIDWTLYTTVDHNDPLLNSLPTSTNTMMFGLGVLFKTDRFFIGASTDNLTYSRLKKVKYLSDQESFSAKMIHYNAGVNFKIASWLTSTHSVYGFVMDDYWRVDLNNTFTFGGWIIGGVSFQKSFDDDIIPKINTGLKLKDKGQIVLMLYSKDYDVPKSFSAQIMAQFNLK